MTMYATIYRADQPVARCVTCGAEKQFHGRPNFSCTAFVAETVEDIDPADLNHRDLVMHCHLLTGQYNRDNSTSEAGMAANDALARCLETYRDELEARFKAVFGVEFDDLRFVMGW